ncbi:MAG: aspartate aminotransferase family protein [Chloroflexi bacterium]|nr:aspartate aminotransferase family protein [Chloroflexota bacterium]
MGDALLENLLQKTQSTYVQRTPRSQQAHQRARLALPGGDTRSSTYFKPHPVYIARGSGAVIEDLDGNRYLDFLNNYTSLVLGHAHPAVVEAVGAALPDGTVFGAPHLAQVELAERICARMPGIDLVRFCNSGTEAVMYAVRLARIYTGKPLVIKMEGGYHGTSDVLEISVHPDVAKAGPPDKPLPLPESRGIPPGLAEVSPVAPFNDAEAVQDLLEEHRGQVAAVLLEPMMGSAGAIPPQPGYLQKLRELTRQYGCLLIFDEVQTMRFSPGGAQALYGVVPDITAIGKIIGGGFPIGGVGGTREIMSVYDPEKPGSVSHGGTFNGHPLAMIAGCATLDVLDQAAIDRLNLLAGKLIQGLREAFAQHGMRGQVTGAGSILNVHFTPQSVVNYRGAESSPEPLTRLLHLLLLERGIYTAKRGMLNISVPMAESDVQKAVEAFDDCLAVMRPAIAEAVPELLG